jgi:hypothetical protein
MASRKTVFGIGVPQDPGSPDSGPLAVSGGTAGDAEDRSSPTVVDDQKVAEGLKQLRSWYQGDGQDLTPDGIPVARPPRGVVAGSLARPTAVGHATAPPAAVQQQPRPFAPDPMRATMYGHDVHSFDVDAPAETSATPVSAAPPSTSTALVLASSSQEESALSVATPVPESSRRGSSGSFQLAQQVQAERLQRPVGMRRSSQEMAAAVRPPISRSQLISRLMFGGGLLALAVAVVMWFQSESGSDGTPSAPVPPPPANVAPQPAWVPTPAPPEREAVKPTTASATTAERALVPAAMRARPGAPAPIVAPRGERALPAPAVTRRRAPKVEVEKAADGDDETPGETAEREPSEKKTEPAAVPEPPAPPVRKKEAPARRDRSRVGVDSDATMPPSED